MTEKPSDIGDVTPPPASIVSLIEVHALQVLVFAGKQPNPHTGEATVNLDLAKYNIDMIEVIRDKTKGNLTDEEESVLGRYLSLAQMAYVEAAQSKKAEG